MANAFCKICKKKFYVKPNWLKRGWGKYCSRGCQFEAQKKGKFVECDTCRNKAWKMPKDLKHSKSGKFFCSKSCQTLWRNKVYSGLNHPFWAGGIRVYRKILSKSDKNSFCVRCHEKDQRVLTAHHKDENRKNNDIRNLVWLCYNCHYLIHHDKLEKQKFMETLV